MHPEPDLRARRAGITAARLDGASLIVPALTTTWFGLGVALQFALAAVLARAPWWTPPVCALGIGTIAIYSLNHTVQEWAQNLKSGKRVTGARSPAALADSVAEYNASMFEVCGVHNLHTLFPLGTSFAGGTKYADKINNLAYPEILALCRDLYDKLELDAVPGVLIEFGVADGYWLSAMLDHMEKTNTIRGTWGFDSFEGLPVPHPVYDGPKWKQGQFATGLDRAQSAVRADCRPHVRLMKGWFQETLRSSTAQEIGQVAFAKIDCDLYESSVECLRFLDDRLSDGAVLMFDDWTHSLAYGETRAFVEWARSTPQYRFELIGFINHRIAFRVWRNAPARSANEPAKLVRAIGTTASLSTLTNHLPESVDIGIPDNHAPRA